MKHIKAPKILTHEILNQIHQEINNRRSLTGEIASSTDSNRGEGESIAFHRKEPSSLYPFARKIARYLQRLGLTSLITLFQQYFMLHQYNHVYEMAELGAFYDINFIENAYKSILQREVDPDGSNYYLPLLRSGKLSKSELDIVDLTNLLTRPDFIIENIVKSKKISLTNSAKSIDVSNISGAIDVEAKVPELFVARTHPLKDTIDEIREIFVTLGFSEILGNMTQSSFWNFDALFTPQDHPARELQDTFFLDGISAKKIGTVEQIRKVSDSHKKNWRYQWDINEARKMVLRTHTTCVTIKHLAENKPDEARIFSLGRVFRNEKVSYKHLVEFNQIEGIVVGKDANLRNLMGIQREFYKRIGITKIKFWPTFFPYTEPSLQTMVYNEKLGKWIELFGMGIFRPEVTKPLGITKPVLAWGGGIERIAMLKYDLDDVREFYNNNLGWLRSNTKCQ